MTPSPTQVQILLTERCNLRCRHCAVPAEDSPAAHELELSAWRDFLRHAVAGGVRSVVISGGEALLRPEAVDLATYAHELGVDRTTLVTNGLLFRGNVPGRIAAAQTRFAGFGVHVSVDGASAATHDWMRGPGAFQRTLRSVDRLRAAGGRVTGLHTVLHRDNRHELAACARLAADLDVEVWTVFPVASLGRAAAIQDRRLDSNAWREVIDELREHEQTYGFAVSLMGPVYTDEWSADEPDRPNPSRDRAGQTCIGPDGEIFTCPPLRDRPVGHVHTVTGPAEWSAMADRVAERLERTCGGCKFLLLCAGVNLGQPYRPSTEDGPRGMPTLDLVR